MDDSTIFLAAAVGAVLTSLFAVCFMLGYLWARPAVSMRRVNIQIEGGEIEVVDCPNDIIVTVTDYDIEEDGVVQTFVGEEEANVQGGDD